MKLSVKLAVCFMATLCTVLASAQLPSAREEAASITSTSPAAYVYVLRRTSSNGSELDGYSADSNGALTRLAGSPFWTSSSNPGGLANTTHWLFASDASHIYSFSIASDGSLKQVSSVSVQKHDPYGGTSGALFLDHTGATVYDYESDGIGDNFYEFFSKNSSTGGLSYFGSSSVSAAYGYLAFTGNNAYAYGASCIQLSAQFYGFSRRSDGSLTSLSIDPPLPDNNNYGYCPAGAAADPASNLAIPVFQKDVQGNPFQLSVYTADSSGNLTTNSTAQNMPYTSVGWINYLLASPAGNLLAVGGMGGLQVFYFNGSNPITPYTGLLATHEMRSLAWDNHNHLFGISPSGRLYAFRVTTTGYKQAPGSPYSISDPQAISVLSK